MTSLMDWGRSEDNEQKAKEKAMTASNSETPTIDAIDAAFNRICIGDAVHWLREEEWKRVKAEFSHELSASQKALEEARNGWIKCSERLPEGGGEVLVCDLDGRVRSTFEVYVRHLWRDANDNQEECIFTHWMPLPAAPSEKV